MTTVVSVIILIGRSRRHIDNDSGVSDHTDDGNGAVTALTLMYVIYLRDTVIVTMTLMTPMITPIVVITAVTMFTCVDTG